MAERRKAGESERKGRNDEKKSKNCRERRKYRDG